VVKGGKGTLRWGFGACEDVLTEGVGWRWGREETDEGAKEEELFKEAARQTTTTEKKEREEGELKKIFLE